MINSFENFVLMGCAVGRHLKEVLIESGTNDRCPFVFSYMFLIPRLFPSGLLILKKKKKSKMKHFEIHILGAGQTKLLILISEL